MKMPVRLTIERDCADGPPCAERGEEDVREDENDEEPASETMNAKTATFEAGGRDAGRAFVGAHRRVGRGRVR